MSRLDKLKEQHPDLNISIIDMIAKIDPTETYKYTEFLIKTLQKWFESKDIMLYMGIDFFGDNNVETLNEFENHCKAKRIKNSDISTYVGFEQMRVEVKLADDIVKQKEFEKQTIKIYEEGQWLALIPLSFEASKLYGSNTKWCTTQEKYWNEYIKHSKLIYIINRSTNEKFAISIKKNSKTEIQAWLSNDDEISPMLLDLPMGMLMAINGEIRKKETNFELMNVGVKKEPILKVVKRKKISDLPSSSVMGLPNEYNSFIQNLLEENIGNYGVGNTRELVKQYLSPNDWLE
tara:strand:+ start:1513 stop:2385 length:873 start_codon:yes stop_codon:yes gene_type:complete